MSQTTAKVFVKFNADYSSPGGPGYNRGEIATFSPEEAEYITKVVKRGDAFIPTTTENPTTTDAPASKAPGSPSHDKMIKQPGIKKSRLQLEEDR